MPSSSSSSASPVSSSLPASPSPSPSPSSLSSAAASLLRGLPPHTAGALALSSSLSLALLGTRMALTGNHVTFAFLAWNLFLAALPLFFALVLRVVVDGGRAPARVAVAAVVFVLWLGFLPNAPYLVSDLVHLRPRAGAPFWLDLLMLASFAVTGLWCGGAALAVVAGVVASRASVGAARVVVVGAAGLAGLGVHLGRFDRWNTWDLVKSPAGVFADVIDSATRVEAVAFAAAFAVLLLAAAGRMSESPTRSTV